MVKYHQKSISAPKSWPLVRKKEVFTVRALPSGQPKQYALPIALFMKGIIKCANTQKEVKYIIHNKQVLINGNRVRDEKIPVGLFDVVEIPDLKECYRVFLDTHGRLIAVKIPEKEKQLNLVRIVGKNDVDKNNCQINGDNGRNILVPKKEAAQYRCGDSVLFNRSTKKIQAHLPFKTGCTLFFIGGKSMGMAATLDAVRDGVIGFTTLKGKAKAETAQRYAVVIGAEKTEITLPEETHE